MRRKLTMGEVKDRLSTVNPDVEVLSTEYVNARAKLKCNCLIDNYKWSATWDSLQNGSGCPKCAGNIRLTIEEVKTRLGEINPNLLILSNEYVDNNKKLKCMCLIDGNEWFISWNKLSQGRGCPVCSDKSKSEKTRLTIEEIIERLKDINTSVKIISDTYETAHVKLKCKCLVDGSEFMVSWHSLSQGTGCPVCGGTTKLTLQEAIERVDGVNTNVKIISEEYVNIHTKLKCICLTHNAVFYEALSSLITGIGCDECRVESCGIYSPRRAEKHKKQWTQETAEVYIIEAWNDDEHFYKIGITTKGVKARFSGVTSMPYEYKVLKIVKTNRYEASYLESNLHEKHRSLQYSPKIKFGGHTECFSGLLI